MLLKELHASAAGLIASFTLIPVLGSNAQSHPLCPLVETNRLGNYVLHPAWTGVERVTARTGWYARTDEVKSQTERRLRCDRFTVTPGPVLSRIPEERFICETAGGEPVPGTMFGYRSSLPTDSELVAVREDFALTNLFGWNPFLSATNHAEAIGLHCFALAVPGAHFNLGTDQAIETLYVTFLKSRPGPKIDSVLIRRALLRQEQQ